MGVIVVVVDDAGSRRMCSVIVRLFFTQVHRCSISTPTRNPPPSRCHVAPKSAVEIVRTAGRLTSRILNLDDLLTRAHAGNGLGARHPSHAHTAISRRREGDDAPLGRGHGGRYLCLRGVGRWSTELGGWESGAGRRRGYGFSAVFDTVWPISHRDGNGFRVPCLIMGWEKERICLRTLTGARSDKSGLLQRRFVG